ncbi:unnamed protein product [Rhizophagus irregularis]|nr:unnamed protein product [Rhizophagus irregularis]
MARYLFHHVSDSNEYYCVSYQNNIFSCDVKFLCKIKAFSLINSETERLLAFAFSQPITPTSFQLLT